MKRNLAHKILNPVLAVLLAGQVLSGLFRHQLPRGFFGPFHEVVGIALAVAVLLHLVLNWNWVKANYRRGP